MSSIKNSVVFHIFSLIALSVLFLHEIFRMYFWKDDYGLIYNLQNHLTFPFPYHQMVSFYEFFYKLFGIQPLGYFVSGLIAFIFSMILFYFLIYKLFRKKSIAFIASLIYVTAPVGIDTTFQAITFAMSYFFVGILFIILLLLLEYQRTKKFWYYIILLGLFAICNEFIPFRSLSFIGVIVLFEVFHFRLPLFKNNKREIIGFIFRQTLLSAVWMIGMYIRPTYFISENIKDKSSAMAGIFNYIFEPQLIIRPFLTLVNVLLGGFAYPFFGNFTFYDRHHWVSYAVLVIVFLAVAFLIYKRKKYKFSTLPLFIFALLSIYIVNLSFYPFSSKDIEVGVFRHMVVNLPFYALITTCMFIMLKNIFAKQGIIGYIPYIFLLTTIFVNIYSTQVYMREFNTRSFYAKQFWRQLKNFIPEYKKDTLIYIHPEKDPQVKYRLTDSVRGGDGPGFSFAVHYNKKIEDILAYVKDFNQLLIIIKENQSLLNSLHAFNYSYDGLHENTYEIKKEIQKKLRM